MSDCRSTVCKPSKKVVHILLLSSWTKKALVCKVLLWCLSSFGVLRQRIRDKAYQVLV